MSNNLVLSSEIGISSYMSQISSIPLLTHEEEISLSTKWLNEGDVTAAHTLVTSHLRLVVKIALGYRFYGLPVFDLISEGNIGLMKAVKKFDPSKGFRLATYAMWWIKAAIHDYILKSWSLLKVGTSAAQKKLFFNLKKIKNRISAYSTLSEEQVDIVADELGVSRENVKLFDNTISNSIQSLNSEIGDSQVQLQDMIATSEDAQITTMLISEEATIKSDLMKKGLMNLKDREREILCARRMSEIPETLEILSQKYNISRERVRQIEDAALKKLKEFMLSSYSNS